MCMRYNLSFLDLKFEADNYLIMYNCWSKTFSCVCMYIIYHYIIQGKQKQLHLECSK